MTWLDTLAQSPALEELAARVEAGGPTTVRGVVGSSTTLLVAAIARTRQKGRLGPVLYVAAHLDDADEAAEELEALGIEAVRLPAMEVVPGEATVNLELLAERLALVRRVCEGDVPPVITAPIQSLMQAVPNSGALGASLRVVRPNDTLDIDELATWLTDGGYRRVETIEAAAEFAIRGGIIDVFPAGG